MATQKTLYLASDGTYFADSDIANTHQTRLNKSLGQAAANNDLKEFLDYATINGHTKVWYEMKLLREKPRKKMTDGIKMLRDIFVNDFELVYKIAASIAAHKYELPYSVLWYNAETADFEEKEVLEEKG